MDKIRKPGSNRAMQDAFLDLLRAGHSTKAACDRLRCHPTQFYNERVRDEAFGARWHAAKSIRVQYRKPESAWTNATGEAFLKAMVEKGSAAAAARAVGVVLSTAYAVRNRDADFAAAWYNARRQVAEQIDDKLLEGALHGYEEVTEVDGEVVRRTRRANPRIMLKLVERIESDRRSNGGKWVEITPERVAKARLTLRDRLLGGGTLTTMHEAVLAASLRPALPLPDLPPAKPEPEPEIEDAVPGRSLWD